MKKLSMFLVAVMSVFVLSGVATAYTWTDTYNPTDQYITWGGSYSYTHDLTNNSPPFVPGQDLIYGYSLEIKLYDDKKGWDEILGGEVVNIDLPGIISDGGYNFSLDNNVYGWSVAGLFSLNAFGKYDVTFSSLWGEFFFDSSTLVAKGEYNSVPEPATMLLLGLGLVGLAGVGRKKFNS